MLEEKNVIKDVVNEIPLPEELEEKVIWNIKINKDKRKTNHKRRRKNISGFRTMIAASLFIVLGFTFTVSSLNTAKKSVVNTFFDDTSVGKVKELMKTEKQSVKIDNYTISMTGALYDNNTHVGYCVFEIENSEGPVEARIKRGMCVNDCFGKDGRFSFRVIGHYSDSSEYTLGLFDDSFAEKKDGKLYLYYSFFADYDEEDVDVAECYENIILYDAWNDDYSEKYFVNGSYTFTFQNNTDIRSGSAGKLTATISPIAVIVNDPYERVVSDVVIVLKNGETIYENYIHQILGHYERATFGDIIDISEVDYIKVEEFDIYLD